MQISRWAVLGAAFAALAVAGCGDDEVESTPNTTGSSAASKVKPPPTSPPTEIPVDTALPKRPPAGKSIIYLQCELPACGRTAPGFKAAADALGWKSKVEVYKNANPGAGLQQAINEKPDYIAITGIPTAAMKAPLAAAAKAKIPVLSCGTTDEPAPGGYAMECGGTLERDAEYLGSWITNDSGGDANVVAVSIPQFSALVTITDWFKKSFTGMCSGCKFDDLDVTVDDVGSGAVPQKLVAYLQSHPDVNYVLFTFADLATGSPEALKSANLADKVKLVGAVENQGIVKGIKDGTYKAWTLSPNEYMGATMVDGAARLSVGESLGGAYQEAIYHNPTWVLDSAEQADALASSKDTWPGPEDYLEQYKKLWQGG